MTSPSPTPSHGATILIGQLTGNHIRSCAPALPFGQSVRGSRDLFYDPVSRSNLLLAGPARSGKSNAGDVLAAVARVQGASVLGIRAQGVEDSRFSSFANGLEDAERIIVNLYTELRKRMATLKKKDLRSVEYLPARQQPEHIFLFVDGLAKLPMQTSLHGEELKEARSEFYSYLKRAIDLLSRVGVLVRIHVIVVTDRPVAKAPWNTGVLKMRTAGKGTFDDGFTVPESVDVWPAPSDQELVAELV
ncbi:hypothetical protein [Leifsonia sp. Leaf264]|uniref:hypothetical protein n=1 Tax=Leifsonia sp. Leaf264 TaxID=1736314 RepID=UPI0006F5BA01|nr:hypothetical protein [Leifsonia sp. Leaf264]KQO98563.1 hypothetical protein ASF30_10905 [Leifsonia sp. Leaf264]